MSTQSLIPTERIERSILLIRGHKIILDRDLAELYDVETRALKQAVKRNLNRFPEDFMFVLSEDEFQIWRSQFVTSKSRDKMGLRYSPMAFTEQGVAMLSSVLKSNRAVQVNILIMRAFVRMRQLLASQKGLMQKILDMEKKYDEQFKGVFAAIRALMTPQEPGSKNQIGFRVDEKKGK